MAHDYIKIFSGNSILAGRIIEGLQEIGISPVVKDESASGRMAGFPTALSETQDLYVQQVETEKAQAIIDQILANIKA